MELLQDTYKGTERIVSRLEQKTGGKHSPGKFCHKENETNGQLYYHNQTTYITKAIMSLKFKAEVQKREIQDKNSKKKKKKKDDL